MSRLSIVLAFALVGCQIHVYEQGNGHDQGDPNTGGGIPDAGVECGYAGHDGGGCEHGYGDAGIQVTNDAGGWNNYPPDAGIEVTNDAGGWNNYPPDAGWAGFVDGGFAPLDAVHP